VPQILGVIFMQQQQQRQKGGRPLLRCGRQTDTPLPTPAEWLCPLPQRLPPYPATGDLRRITTLLPSRLVPAITLTLAPDKTLSYPQSVRARSRGERTGKRRYQRLIC